jgi:O-antigen ligase
VTAAITIVLFFGILTMWMSERWAWGLVQCGIFVIAAVRLPGIRWRPANVVVFMAAGWPILQIVARSTVSSGQTWLAALEWWTFAIVFLLAADLFADRLERGRFLRVSAVGGACLAVVSVVQKYSSPGLVYWVFPSGYRDDVLGPFVNRNQYAAWIELLFPIALWLALSARHARPIYGVSAAAMLGSVIASASRAGCILVLFEAIVVFTLVGMRREDRHSSRFRAPAAFATVAAIAILVMGYQDLLGRLASSKSENLRLDALRASVQMVCDRPWMGSGLGTWSSMYPRYAGFDAGVFMNQAHNDWVQWAAEGGLPFAILIFLFTALLWKSLFRSIYGVGAAAFLLHALVDYPMQQRPALAAWFFATAGAAYASRNAARASKHDDLLRGDGGLRDCVARGDPPGVQTPCAAGPS